jgi:hypothetical protein
MTAPGQPITLTLDESDIREIMTNIQILSGGISELRSNNKVSAQTIGYLCKEVEQIRGDIKAMQERGTLHTSAVFPLLVVRVATLERERKKDMEDIQRLLRDMMWRLIAIAASISATIGVISFVIGRFGII